MNTVVIHLPPLRERLDDLGPLARHFLAHYVRRYGKPLTGFADDAWQAMRRHRWPGNVRELAHSVERAVLLAAPQATAIAARDLGLQMSGGAR